MTVPPSRPPALALAFGALALAALITLAAIFALGLGPFGRPIDEPTSQATAGATGSPPTSTPVQGGPPGSASTASPSASPAVSQPPATPSSATDALLAHVPERVRASCAPSSFEQPAIALV